MILSDPSPSRIALALLALALIIAAAIVTAARIGAILGGGCHRNHKEK